MKFLRIICTVSIALTVASCADSVYTTEATDNAQITKDPYHYQLVTLNENVDYNVISSLGNGLTLVDNNKEGSLYRVGAINYDGEIVIPFDYIEIGVFSENISLVKDVDGKFKYIDLANNVVFDNIKGKEIVNASSFNDGYAVVVLSGEEGSFVIDINGNVVIESENQFIYEYAGNKMFNVLSISDNSFVKVIDIEGKEIPQLENKVTTYTGSSLGYYQDEATGLYGIINLKDYNKITECVLIKGTKFEQNAALVTSTDNELLIIDSSAEVLENLSITYKGISTENYVGFNGGFAILNYDNGTGSIVINNIGKELLGDDYSIISQINENITVVKNQEGKYGYLSVTGDELLDLKFDVVTDICDGKGIVALENTIYLFSVSKQSRE